jgi:rare lipoprotein A
VAAPRCLDTKERKSQDSIKPLEELKWLFEIRLYILVGDNQSVIYTSNFTKMNKFLAIIGFITLSAFIYSTSIEKGRASYYSSKFEGKKTSSGEIFRQDSLTAAHKTLSFGTMVKITNLKNDSTVIVRVNDRLSKNSRHSIDVTLRAAKTLNFVHDGITIVTIEKLNR